MSHSFLYFSCISSGESSHIAYATPPATHASKIPAIAILHFFGIFSAIFATDFANSGRIVGFVASAAIFRPQRTT